MEKSVYISEITFRNCQSLKNISYNLTPGLNVIIGLNSAGKSVLFKVLKVAVGSELFKGNNLKHLISYGEKNAAAIFTFSDGSAGGFIADCKTIIYLYKNEYEKAYQKLSKPHPDFVRKMSIIMDEKTKFILNILDADQELLFVNSKESTNFSILSLISDNEQLEELMPYLEERFYNTKDYLSRTEYIRDMINSKLSVMEKVNIFDIKQKISIGDLLLPIAYQLFQLYGLVDKITSIVDVDFGYCDKIINLIRQYRVLSESILKLCLIKDIDFDYSSALLKNLNNTMDLKKKFIEYHKTALLLQELQKNMDSIVIEMQQGVRCVDCSVKGKVYFFDEGCIPVDEVDMK